MKYSFEQFNTTTIENPTIEIDMTRIVDNTVSKMLTVPVVLVTDTARFGVDLNEVIYVETWNDSDIEILVQNRLNDFIID